METKKNYPLRIHKSLLPKKNKLQKELFDEKGFLYGFFVFNENDCRAIFSNNDTVLFECTKPTITVMTHLIMRCFSGVFVGYDKELKPIAELCELTFFFNY